MAKAAAAYVSAVAAADRQLAKEAGEAQRAAMKSDDLAAANDAAAVKAEADKAKPPPPDPIAGLRGRWVFDQSDGPCRFVVSEREARNDRVGMVGVPTRSGSSLVINWGNEWIDRLTLTADNRVVKENWHLSSGNRFPEDRPETTFVGRRD